MHDQKKIVVVGGGTAGWLTAHLLNHLLNFPGQERHCIVVVESASIGRIGVGEATVPTLLQTLQDIGIGETDFIARGDATFKHGIKFRNWLDAPKVAPDDAYFHAFENFKIGAGGTGQSYLAPVADLARRQCIDVSTFWLHRARAGRADAFAAETGIQPFLCEGGRAPKRREDREYRGAVTYAYHVDAEKFGDLLAERGQQRLIDRIIDDVTEVQIGETGDITGITTEAGRTIAGDFFVDCTGFSGLLIEKALGVPYLEYGKHLLCDRAIALPVRRAGRNIRPYTTATALEGGWCWEIDLQSRTGTGYVYSSDFVSDNDAEDRLRTLVGGRAQDVPARRLRMRVGRRSEAWRRNCVAIGLAAGFVEPLESTGIFLIEAGARHLAEYFALGPAANQARLAYNELMARQFDEIRDFIVLHYCLSRRQDSAFWREVRKRERIPDTLAARLERWRYFLPAATDFADDLHLFSQYNYQAVLFGMGWPVTNIQGRAGMRQPTGGDEVVSLIHAAAERAMEQLPRHEDLLGAIRTAPREATAAQLPMPVPLPLSPAIELISACGLGDRVEVSNGTTAPMRAGLDASGYHVNALVPRGPWRRAMENELRVLGSKGKDQGDLAFVAVVTPPRAIVEQMRHLLEGEVPSDLTGEVPVSNPLKAEAIDKVGREFAALYTDPSREIRHLGLLINRSGYCTITGDKFDNKRIGLHFDGWAQLPFDRRAQAPNRICVNLGAAPRRLLYINLSARDVMSVLASSGGFQREANPTDLGRLLMQRYPDFPVISLEIRPGEAYIAPTENCIHDGASDRTAGADVTYTMIGFFHPPRRSNIVRA